MKNRLKELSVFALLSSSVGMIFREQRDDLYHPSSFRSLGALELHQRITGVTDIHSLPTLGCLSGNQSRGRLGRCDRSRRHLERLGVGERVPPEILGQALGTPFVAQLTRGNERCPHTLWSALNEQLSARFVDALGHLLVTDEKVPFRTHLASLFTDFASVQFRGGDVVGFHGSFRLG